MSPKFRSKPQPAAPAVEAPSAPRFTRPKVMCIDLDGKDVQTIRDGGYNVTEGTLGLPYAVERSDSYVRPSSSLRLPGFAEQEVVIVQQAPPKTSPTPTGAAPIVTSDPAVWSSCKSGVVNIRPWSAHLIQENMSRIMRHTGVAICFCEPKRPSELVWARGASGYGGLRIEENRRSWSVWDMLAGLYYLEVNGDHGEEIQALTGDGLLAPLAPHLETAIFNCTMAAIQGSGTEERWARLAVNKYGATVAGVMLGEDKDEGPIFLLPQVEDVGATVRVLLDDVLPALVSKLFPESDRFAWRFQDPYELPEVQRLGAEIISIRAEAQRRESELQERIDAAREADGWLHDLLTGTGDTLVDAVERALHELGLPEARKVDEEAEEKGRELREDIQVVGERPPVLVEVKGIASLPKESESLQVQKYIAPRMREWKRTDIRGLSVINHQRAIPPLERQNEHVFQPDVIENAKHHGLALLTAFDLYRLVVNKRRLGWTDDSVVPLLYRDGRVEVVPAHYEEVGVVDGFFEKAEVVAITATGPGFSVGNRLAFKLPIDFVEEEVSSIHFDDNPVETAAAGQRVGVKTALRKSQARNGARVFRAITSDWHTVVPVSEDALDDVGEPGDGGVAGEA